MRFVYTLGKQRSTLMLNKFARFIIRLRIPIIILVVALTGGTGNFVDWWNEIWGSQAIDAQAAVLKCDGLCTRYDTTGDGSLKQQFCSSVIEISGVEDEPIELTCAELVANGKVSCPSITC